MQRLGWRRDSKVHVSLGSRGRCSSIARACQQPLTAQSTSPPEGDKSMRDGSAGLFWRSDDDALIISPRWPPWGHEVRDESRNLDQRPFARQAAWVPTNVPLYRLAAEEEKNDVGGLLLLFCATRTIISPAYLLIQYYLIFAHLGGISRVFAVAPWLSFLVAGDVLLTALGMWAGRSHLEAARVRRTPRQVVPCVNGGLPVGARLAVAKARHGCPRPTLRY